MIFEREADFEEALISVLKQHGWDDAGGVLRYPTEDDLIQNWADILYQNNICDNRLNGCPLTKTEMAQVVEQVELLKTPLALNSFINGKTVSIKRDNPDDTAHLGKDVSLKIYDRQEIAAGQSRYQIAQQPQYRAKNKLLNSRRGDVCLLINGMPVIHIELKRSGVPLSQATHQIEKYAHEGVFTGLFRLVQVFVAMTPDDAVYFANPGSGAFNPAYQFHWADLNNEPICANRPDRQGCDEWKRFASRLLSIPMAHQLIGFYTIADTSDGALKVLRSYQYYAVSAIADRVRTCRWDEPVPTGVPGRLGGYVWHTTGSGKTMTSFKAAQLIATSKDAEKVIFLMDRIELGKQSLDEYRAFADDADDVQGTENAGVLRAKLKNSDPKNTLIVTSIQKMSHVKAGEGGIAQAELDLFASKRMVFIVDECHRSTFGDMLRDIKASFPNAMYFGFTGTPIKSENQKKGCTTAMVFGDCLHSYTIADGLRDGNVLGFDPYMVCTFRDKDVRTAVALDQAKASSIDEVYGNPAKQKVYDFFMDQVPMAGKTDADGSYIKGIEDYLPDSQYSEDGDHPRTVVRDIAANFRQYSKCGKFHAIFATSSIREAINYYRLMRSMTPELKVTALFDANFDDNPDAIEKEEGLVQIISDYNEAYGKDFTIPKWAGMKDDISKRLAHKEEYANIDVRREERLDILIVVKQMLTGFDSKWVNALYLDRLMKDEDIIQAFSRTNRLFGEDKRFGVIRYYRKPHTMKRNIERAVKLYSGDSPVDMFVNKLPANLRDMNTSCRRIREIFESDGVKDFSRNPTSQEACGKFAKEFIELNRYLDAARVQGFSWDRLEYRFRWEDADVEDGRIETVTVEFDERTYLTLAQRYKELFSFTPGPSGPVDVPYELEGYLTEIDTGHIDTEYMNANFKKWLKALHEGGDVDAVLRELHRSFAALSQDEQRLAEVFLHDVERGDVELAEGKTLRDYITSYGRHEKDEQIDALVDFLWCDRALLCEIMSRDVTEDILNEYGRFDRLKESIDRTRARASFESAFGLKLKPFRVIIKASDLLKRFILAGGFDITDYQVE